jgi:outer membrane protein assembly factor BamB
MKSTRAVRGLPAALLLACLLPSPDAQAVIPSAFGPIQALIVILPQLLLALAAGLVALFRPRTYRMLLAYLLAHPALSIALVGGAVLLAWSPWKGGTGRAAGAEQTGAAWPAFRGGPGRTGAVAGSKGPAGATSIAWKTAFAPGSNVDSSPAVVGNRVYVGIGTPSVFGGGGGSVACLDADTGALAWHWDGKGELTPPLKPVFSSPVVGVEPGPDPAARWLVIGEGYHEDRNCRLVCLDLAPARAPGGKPKLAWSVQTTSHVESTPCLHDGRVYIGAGDDGVWCVELETGRVVWRIEGDAAYVVSDGPRAGALSELEGKTVSASGRVWREGLGAKGKDDPGTLMIEVAEFREAAAPSTAHAPNSGFDRTVSGKVVRKDGRLRIEAPWANPDSESCPIGHGPYVLFGSGIGGQRLNCVEAATGKPVWQAPTPYPAFGPPTIAGDRVLIGVGNGNFLESAPKPAGAVLCVSLQDGRLLWKVDTADTILGAVAVDGSRAYACGRDGTLTVIDLAKGQTVCLFAVGSPMVCSPALAGDALYVTTEAGRLLALDRAAGTPRWAQTLSNGERIISSPSISGSRVFVGTRSKGLFAVGERPVETADAGPPRPWLGPGGRPDRSGAADDRGLPRFEGDVADLLWPTPERLAKPVTGPMAACGKDLYVSMGDALVKVDLATGRVLGETAARGPLLAADARGAYVWDPAAGGKAPPWWPSPVYQMHVDGKLEEWKTGSPVFAHSLHFDTWEGELVCESDVGNALVWRAKPETPALSAPTISGDRVFVASEGKGKAKAFLDCRRLVDGTPLWRSELDDRPVSLVVASGDWVAVATADDRIAPFRASDGKALDPLQVGGKPATPAIWKDTVLVVGDERIAAYDLQAKEWLWNYKDQDKIGSVVGQPLIARGTIWVGTTKKGLLALGVPAAP